MRKFATAFATTAAIVAGAALVGSAQAAPVGLPDGARHAADSLNIIEPAHAWRGKDYCWYEGGWNGAGWYQCGYAGRKGYGWGGPNGWQGWAAPMWGHRMGSHMNMNHMMGRGCCW